MIGINSTNPSKKGQIRVKPLLTAISIWVALGIGASIDSKIEMKMGTTEDSKKMMTAMAMTRTMTG